MEEIKDYESDTIFSKSLSETEKRRQEIEDSLNYNLQLRRQRGEDPMPVIVTFSHIYNTYNSIERERWLRIAYARQTFKNLARMSVTRNR